MDSPVSNAVNKSGLPKADGAVASTSTVSAGISDVIFPAESSIV